MLNAFYRRILRRPSVMFTTAVISAFVFERVIDKGVDNLFLYINRGKLFEDIRPDKDV
ncbi:putative cytochrome b-c1 complex subunit 9 [Taenia solium]|eukprot:TsM_000694800 transcript=TsM_000694800 gene=TsM_000694800